MSELQGNVDIEVAKKLGLNEEEFERIKVILKREPNFTELSIFSVMWSEHCSYKNSIKYLKTLPREGDRLLVEAGEENAGLVDIGDGLGCVFKIESHNHPSAIEPYQGAATGVGGIHRDIFTMGARPIAAMNSLRFGELDKKHTQHLVKGVVSGIGDYGNCLGVPTVGGEVYFDPCYNQNILVNAFSAGIVKVDQTASAIASGPGNPVFIVGSATGKDGIHGATFASADLTEDSADDLPAVQVGDPFQEKLLLEATLEAIQSGDVIGIQDMGAAGITCSTSEMSAKAGTGMKIDLDKVPTRQSDMKAFEILLSESQERMLIVCEKGKEQTILDIFDKWDLECKQIGEVTDTGRLEFFKNGELVADVPADDLVLGGGAPVYDREYKEPAYFEEIKKFSLEDVSIPTDWVNTAKKLFQSPNLVSKKWVYEQYDSMVRTNSMGTNDPSDACIVRVKGTKKSLVMSTDCNSSYVYADPYVGGMIAVSEAARNIVCSGGDPVAITNCLNFGNPYNPEVYYQFVHALKGMGDACRKFKTPVTGGNVSFYNQSVFGNETVPIYPTPTIGMLGIMDDPSNKMTLQFRSPDDLIYLIGTATNDINQSEYLKRIHGVYKSPAPYFDLSQEFEIQEHVKKMIRSRQILSAHDISEGGLFQCLIESSMVNNFGFNVTTNPEIRKDAFLFGEGQSRIVVSIEPAKKDEFESYLKGNDCDHLLLGSVTSGSIIIDNEKYPDIKYWNDIHQNTIKQVLEN